MCAVSSTTVQPGTVQGKCKWIQCAPYNSCVLRLCSFLHTVMHFSQLQLYTPMLNCRLRSSRADSGILSQFEAVERKITSTPTLFECRSTTLKTHRVGERNSGLTVPITANPLSRHHSVSDQASTSTSASEQAEAAYYDCSHQPERHSTR